ncbi:hypothetical protein ORI20_06745 [Mycobacterium sp. CVI_P3]|uniref:DUF4386 domain-containing protein n=1 Tax=Mycobacterium pinniadriaticum TaxID=2994102 RepID=A0ABT3SA71_9MYCO|nr:hypothetical protein [Mycobacterium pinniadriaticum]MCX2929962.1 hypothetical protein [Mycobacterium pinniadriaticum]MCX2936389.1 hypothetical protein [Mycobacterium pinniadriaticum]
MAGTETMYMNASLRILGVWSAAAFFLLWLIGFVFFAQWIPPIPPSDSAEDLAELFRDRSLPIRIGMVLMTIGTVFYLPWSMVLSDLIKEIEGRSFFLSGTQLAAGVLSAMTFFLPAFVWTTAAFRPQRNPEITQALVDLGWLFFITPIAPFILQYVILAIAIFRDKRTRPAFPRWAGYLQLWISISFLPALGAMFFKTGPFAWNGVLVWWIPFAMFTGWFVVMITLTWRAVRQDRQPAEIG